MSDVSKLFDDRSKTYDQIYSDVNPKKLLHQEKQLRLELVKQLILENSKRISDEIIVDIGCGMGNLLKSLREDGLTSSMHGYDVSEEMIRLANANGNSNIKFSVGTFDNISIKPDIVSCIGVIGYQEDQKNFLSKLSSLVKNEGTLVFTVANGDSILRFIRSLLSKIHSLLIRRQKGIKFGSLSSKGVDEVLLCDGFELIEKIYITFGVGLFSSKVECLLDKLLFKYFNNSFIGKFLSLTVIYIYKKNSK